MRVLNLLEAKFVVCVLSLFKSFKEGFNKSKEQTNGSRFVFGVSVSCDIFVFVYICIKCIHIYKCYISLEGLELENVNVNSEFYNVRRFECE